MSKIIKFDFDGSLYSFNMDGWFNNCWFFYGQNK